MQLNSIEHAILHLLYARFFTKVARDLGLHSHDEPFQRLLTQGMINKSHPYCPKCNSFAMKAEMHDKKCKRCGTEYILKSVKMSKSYGNTVDPLGIMGKYGADSARFFILFGASPESGLEWSEEGVGFASKFIKNTFLLLADPAIHVRKQKTIRDTLITYHLNKMIKAVTENFNKISLRDAVNNIIQFISDLTKYKNEGIIKEIYEECREKLIIIFHPIAPHATEEIWEIMGKKGYLSLASWPSFDEQLLTLENDFKWKLSKNILDDIKSIKLIMKKDQLKKISIIVADEWKFQFYSQLMSLIEKTKNQGDIMKKIMQDKALKSHGNFISQTTAKILKNVGKYPKFSLSTSEEHQFFSEIKPIIQQKFKCTTEILLEIDSDEKKAVQALPGRPAIIIS